jgi:squalene-hopene/tetraprenyl-beta-curcumene cyclase
MRPSLVLAALLSVLFITPPTGAQDTKALADQIIRGIRPQQNADGTYGQGFLDTCRVLDLLSRSPRRYTELDGPFFRRAAEQVAAHPSESPAEDAWTVLALAGCVTAPLRAARDEARDRLLESPGAWTDETALLALRTLPPDAPRWGEPPADASAALRCLLAEDPSSVSPPDLEEVDAWTAWARAARLRGVVPDSAPPLPQPGTETDLDSLLETLAQVVVQHGLDRGPAPMPTEADSRPGRVAQPHGLEAGLQHALAFLDARQAHGTFGLDLPGWSGPEPGITAMCLSAALGASRLLGQDPPEWVDDGLDYLAGLQRGDGAILDYGLAVYTTSVALEALVDGGRPGDRDAILRARDFLVSMQADEDLGYDSIDDPHYGGIGYGGDERPDLSNTQMALEAASRAGLPEDSAFTRKALIFLQRNQNLGEVNTERWERAGGGVVVSGNDGGATYMPGSSPAGEDQVGPGVYEARSYGSMTYALTKSYLLCGVPNGDRRLEAALGWILDHYTLDRNPGFADPGKSADGLYYYYLALARTLRMLPADRVVNEQGQPIPWRKDLQDKLLAEQRTDGSWFNDAAPRWFEGAPTLCTAYALLALDAAAKPSGG